MCKGETFKLVLRLFGSVYVLILDLRAFTKKTLKSDSDGLKEIQKNHGMITL